MDDHMNLETARLVLRVPRVRDADAMASYARANRDHFAPWDPVRDEAYFTPEYWREILAGEALDLMTAPSLRFMLELKTEPDGSFVGHCTVSGITRGPFQAASIGYGLDHGAVPSSTIPAMPRR